MVRFRIEGAGFGWKVRISDGRFGSRMEGSGGYSMFGAGLKVQVQIQGSVLEYARSDVDRE